jgi:1A family penicillin-binding protein
MVKYRFHRKPIQFKRPNRRWWYRFFMVLLGLAVFGYVGTLIVFAWFSKDLPTPNKVVRQEGFSSQIYDRNGQLLYEVYKDANRLPVTFDQLPTNLKNATVAVEDKDFYKHGGFDPLAPLRIIKNIFVLHKLTGGSTLTQQLVKNVLLTSDVTVTRKIKEFILAVQIDAKYKKDEVLLMYLNEAPYGGSNWGVGTAAKAYFDKEVKDLDLAECAILAGLPQRPNAYSPFSSTPTLYIDRTNHVLDRMKEDGYINVDTENKAMEEVKSYKFYTNQSQLQAPHFVFWIEDQLVQTYGQDEVDGGGLKVTTTLDLDMQSRVQKIVSDGIDKVEKLGISNGAAVVVDPATGQVLAMVGSRDYNSTKTDGKFNVVTQGLRQPGSAIKPVTYLTALKKGWTPSSLIMDTPVIFPGSGGQPDYEPHNYTGKYNGPMTLSTALGNSINTAAVKMLANVGLKDMLQQAFEMGLSTLEPTAGNLSKYGLAVTLGGADVKMIDLAAAYSSFANGGTKVDPAGILKVEDRSGNVLEQYQQITGTRVMTPQQAFLISQMLFNNDNRVITFGQVNGLIIPNYQVAVKTGTTNDKRDNWTIGWTPNLLAAVWVGNNDNTAMLSVASGVSGASPIWKNIMLSEIVKRPKQDFPIPDQIVSINVDNVSGYPAHDNFPSHTAYFIDGTQPKISDPIHLQLKVCKDQAGLAPPADVANGNYNTKEYFSFKEDDPISTDGKNRWQEGINTWISQQSSQDIYNPPTNYCRSDGTVGANIDSPGDHSTVGNNFGVSVSTTSLNKIVKVEIFANDASKLVMTERPFNGNVQLNDGTYDLKAVVTDVNGSSFSKDIHIGVNKPWDWSPSPTPTMTPVPSPTLIPTGIGLS